jgi:hypothetical protein
MLNIMDLIKKIFPDTKIIDNEIKCDNYSYKFKIIDDILEVFVIYVDKSDSWWFEFTIDKNININFINGEVSVYDIYISISSSLFWNLLTCNEDGQEIGESVVSIMKPFRSVYKNQVLKANKLQKKDA